MDRYECMWLCISGSFLGYVIEMLWYRKLRGKWICRKGVIYGSFSPIYGIAIVGFTKMLDGSKNNVLIFVCGCILGSVFEYVCGYLQEKILGTKSWDYSNKPFQLHGRICLEFAMYWGIIAMAIMNIVQPCFSGIYHILPTNYKEQFITIAFALFVFDCAISGLACMQQRNRREGNRIQNRCTAFLDKHYPDERLEEIYTEIRIV